MQVISTVRLRRTRCFVWLVIMASSTQRPSSQRTRPWTLMNVLPGFPTGSAVQVTWCRNATHHMSYFSVSSGLPVDCFVEVQIYFIFWGWCAGERLSAERMSPALEMFKELVNDTSQIKNQKETAWASVGHFIRSEVHRLSVATIIFLVIRSEEFLMRNWSL